MLYVTITGVDGSGKSTLVHALERQLTKQGKQVCVVREPGGCPTAEAIRAVLKTQSLQPSTDALLMAAARAELMFTTVIPALQADKIVLSDRSVACSCVYQGYVAGLGIPQVWELNVDYGLHGHVPSVEFFLDTPLELVRKRMKSRNQVDRFELHEGERIRAGYLEFYRLGKYPHVHLKPGATISETLSTVLQSLKPYMDD